MTLKRLPLWRTRFETAIDEIKHRPFAWGQNDCGPGLAGKLVLALTGADYASGYVGRYDDAVSAYRLMQAEGFDDLADLVGAILPEIHISRATIGDIAAIPTDTPFRHALGVINGERIFVLTENGMGTVDLLSATRAFKVG